MPTRRPPTVLSEPGAPLPPEAVEVASRVPQWAGATIQIAPLQGVISLNNASYRVDAGGAAFVLRVASAGARQLGIERAEEIAAALAASAAGICPPVLYADPQGHLVTALVRGRHWEPHEFHSPANSERLVATLRRLHAIDDVQADGAQSRRIARLLASAAALGIGAPPETAAYLERLGAFAARRARDTRFQPGLSHNDFWANNFLDDGERLWLVDWEFAGVGDTLFDLATLCLSARYSQEQQAAVLRAYGYTEPGDLAALQDMQRVVFLFEGAWALVQHGLRGSAEYDYQAHAARMFQRLAPWLDEPG